MHFVNKFSSLFCHFKFENNLKNLILMLFKNILCSIISRYEYNDKLIIRNFFAKYRTCHFMEFHLQPYFYINLFIYNVTLQFCQQQSKFHRK